MRFSSILSFSLASEDATGPDLGSLGVSFGRSIFPRTLSPRRESALASMVFSFKAFTGKKWVHLIHCVTFISAAFVWFVGSMAIAHDWI